MSEFAEGYAMGADRNNNCGCMPWGMGGFGGGFGGWGGDWLAIIVLAALFGNGGWGFGGFGGGGGYGGSIYGDVQRGFDTAGINNKLNGIENGLCDGFYAVNTGMLNGFAGVERSILQNGYETRSAITDVGYALKDCCCQNLRAIDGVNYNMATEACKTRQAIADNTNRLIELWTNDKIATLTAEKAALTAQLSQNAQTATLLSELRPIARPAYITCSPYQAAPGFGGNACGLCG
jgi:hypothetical protein